MPIEVTMPKFGLTMQEGTLQRYFKQPSAPVSAGEPLYEVETEKVLYVVEAPGAGRLALWLHEEGAVVECGGLVAVIAEDEEDLTALRTRYEGRGGPALRPAPPQPAQTWHGAQPATTATAATNASAAAEGRRAISPVARKLAAERGVELAGVVGTGPGGRVTREDVERAARDGGAAASPSAASERVGAPDTAATPPAAAGPIVAL